MQQNSEDRNQQIGFKQDSLNCSYNLNPAALFFVPQSEKKTIGRQSWLTPSFDMLWQVTQNKLFWTVESLDQKEIDLHVCVPYCM